jgi:hypothetical protein
LANSRRPHAVREKDGGKEDYTENEEEMEEGTGNGRCERNTERAMRRRR